MNKEEAKKCKDQQLVLTLWFHKVTFLEKEVGQAGIEQAISAL
jgi:hypothetical protein